MLILPVLLNDFKRFNINCTVVIVCCTLCRYFFQSFRASELVSSFISDSKCINNCILASQEAYCVSKTKSPNKKILLSRVLCSFKFSIITVCSYVCSLCNYWLGVFLVFSLCLLYFVFCVT